jgi:hypothetical protein
LVPQGDVQIGLLSYREKRPSARSGVSLGSWWAFGANRQKNWSTQLMLHELLISPVVSARVADVALLTAY